MLQSKVHVSSVSAVGSVAPGRVMNSGSSVTSPLYSPRDCVWADIQPT